METFPTLAAALARTPGAQPSPSLATTDGLFEREVGRALERSESPLGERLADSRAAAINERRSARDAGFDNQGWAWGSYHGYHGLARFYDGQFVNKGRIIDGAMCFGESESVRCDAARLVTDGFDYADIDEDAGEALAAVMRHAPSDHFPVQTDLTLRYF